MLDEILHDAYQNTFSISVSFGHEIDIEATKRIAHEAMARFIFKMFTEHKIDSDFFTTIDKQNVRQNNGTIEELQYEQRKFKKYLNMYKSKIQDYNNQGLEHPNLMKKESYHKGISLDLANIDLVFLDEFKLINYVHSRKICNSKKVSNTELIDAFKQYDGLYSEAQKISKEIESELSGSNKLASQKNISLIGCTYIVWNPSCIFRVMLRHPNT